jgi:hypothetical protein
MTDTGKSTSITIESSRSVEDFLAKMKSTPVAGTATGRGRLIIALDATASRQPTWDTACHLQAEMFREAGALGTLNIQLAYYRGLDECRTSRWISRSDELLRLMERIDCRAGTTQIGKVLAHARRETQLLKVSALVLSGMRWRRIRTRSFTMPTSSGAWACLHSCSRKVTIGTSSTSSAPSHA